MKIRIAVPVNVNNTSRRRSKLAFVFKETYPHIYECFYVCLSAYVHVYEDVLCRLIRLHAR